MGIHTEDMKCILKETREHVENCNNGVISAFRDVVKNMKDQHNETQEEEHKKRISELEKELAEQKELAKSLSQRILFKCSKMEICFLSQLKI